MNVWQLSRRFRKIRRSRQSRRSRGFRREPSGVKVLLLNYRLNYLRLLAGGCSRGFEVHAPRLRNGVRMQAHTPGRLLVTFFASPWPGAQKATQKRCRCYR